MLTLYILFTWLLGICYGFVLISSAAAGQSGAITLFKQGESLKYRLQTTILLREKGLGAKNVGFQITGDVSLESIWGADDQRLLKIQLKSLQLNIRSRKAPTPDGFVPHWSKLSDYTPQPSFLTWTNGQIDHIYVPRNEPTSLTNLAKGVASLFQFKLLDLETNETDSSGLCNVHYRSLEPLNKFQKIKRECSQSHGNNRGSIVDVVTSSTRLVEYELDHKLSRVDRIESREYHEVVPSVKEDVGNVIETELVLTRLEGDGKSDDVAEATTLDDALKEISVGDHTVETLLTKQESQKDPLKTFTAGVDELRDNLKGANMGTLVSAKAFLRLVELAHESNRDDINKAIASKKNHKILPQLYEVLGYVQRDDIHEAVMKKLHFDKEDHLDLSERYLWALSLSLSPNQEILHDLLNRFRKNSDNYPEKVRETLVLTLASMASKARDHRVSQGVEEVILNGLDYAKGDARFAYLRALKNLHSVTTIPVLIKVIKKDGPKDGVLAFKALRQVILTNRLKAQDETLRKVSTSTLLQLDRKYDTSARTLAIDLLLLQEPVPQDTIKEFLSYLKTNDSSYEVKQYLFQRLQMKSDESPDFYATIRQLIKSDPWLNNYSVLAPRGLSTALKRSFVRSNSITGSLVTVQEMLGGIVKRGTVDVVIDQKGQVDELFSLGIFSGGLSSFLSSDSAEGADEEVATAGMDLTILGTQIRPFVFFSGQGELMGHVWSGTASERTTAFQSLVLLQDYTEELRLAPGFVAEVSVRAAASFDLSGKIEISIWGRTAESVVEKSAGLLVSGLAIVDSDFVRSQVEFGASVEPKLNLKSDIDFSGPMNLCMRVTQPDSTFRHNVFKIERIKESKHKIRLASYKRQVVPGTTYSLNRKNNEMCSAMFPMS